jgi:phage/plasmid-associated DNA primase
MVMNQFPTYNGADQAMARRVCVVPFLAHFTNEGGDQIGEEQKDRAFVDRLFTASGLSDMFLVMLQGSIDWYKNDRKFHIPSHVHDRTVAYLTTMDDVQGWLTKRTLKSTEKRRVSRSVLHSDYKHWANSKGINPKSAKAFYQVLKDKRFVPKKSGSLRYFNHLVLQPVKRKAGAPRKHRAKRTKTKA